LGGTRLATQSRIGDGRAANFHTTDDWSAMGEPTPPTSKPAEPAAPAMAPGLRIVMIEDNPDILDTLCIALSFHDHAVTSAVDGISGLAAIRAARPDAVICDIGLPGEIDGYGVARTVRADPQLAGTRLIALSGYGQDSDRQHSLDAGFDVHLVKPVQLDELAEALLPGGMRRD